MCFPIEARRVLGIEFRLRKARKERARHDRFPSVITVSRVAVTQRRDVRKIEARRSEFPRNWTFGGAAPCVILRCYAPSHASTLSFSLPPLEYCSSLGLLPVCARSCSQVKRCVESSKLNISVPVGQHSSVGRTSSSPSRNQMEE